MNKIILTEKEMLVLATSIGGRQFYEINDPFIGNTKEEIAIEIPDIQAGVERKGYAVSNFDGSFTIKADVKAMLRTCVFCKGYVVLYGMQNGEKRKKDVLFFRDSSTVLMSQEDEANYSLQCIEAADYIAENLTLHDTMDDSLAIEVMPVIVDTETMMHLRSKNEQDACDKLVQAGCTMENARAIYESLQHEEDVLILQATDITRHQHMTQIGVAAGDRVVYVASSEQTQNDWSIKLTAWQTVYNAFSDTLLQLSSYEGRQ